MPHGGDGGARALQPAQVTDEADPPPPRRNRTEYPGGSLPLRPDGRDWRALGDLMLDVHAMLLGVAFTASWCARAT